MTRAKKTIPKPVTITNKVRDYGNDPFVIEKNRRAKAFLEKYGFPKEFDSDSRKK